MIGAEVNITTFVLRATSPEEALAQATEQAHRLLPKGTLKTIEIKASPYTGNSWDAEAVFEGRLG